MPGEVPNPYKAAIGRAITAAQTPAASAATALDAAKKAFAAKAWTGGSSATFGAELAGHAGSAKRAADASITALQAMHTKEPDKVPLDSWQLHWRNL